MTIDNSDPVVNGVDQRAVLSDGTDVDIVVGRMDDDADLRDHWKVTICKHPARFNPPIMESYPLPPEAASNDLQAMAEELIQELNQQAA